MKKSDSELGMDEDITRRNLIHDAGLAALDLSLHFEFRELPECLLLVYCVEKLAFSMISVKISESKPSKLLFLLGHASAETPEIRRQ